MGAYILVSSQHWKLTRVIGSLGHLISTSTGSPTYCSMIELICLSVCLPVCGAAYVR